MDRVSEQGLGLREEMQALAFDTCPSWKPLEAGAVKILYLLKTRGERQGSQFSTGPSPSSREEKG